MIVTYGPSQFHRAATLALAEDGSQFVKALGQVFEQAVLTLQPGDEGPSTIPKNTPGMSPAPQVLMFPPFFQPISIMIGVVIIISFFVLT